MLPLPPLSFSGGSSSAAGANSAGVSVPLVNPFDFGNVNWAVNIKGSGDQTNSQRRDAAPSATGSASGGRSVPGTSASGTSSAGALVDDMSGDPFGLGMPPLLLLAVAWLALR